MNQTVNPANILPFLTQPAFLVENGIITDVNSAAAAYQINIGASVLEMIIIGRDDYATFSSGKLYLELSIGRAWVSLCGGFHLFCLDDTFSSPELRAFALAAQHLRAPLSNAVSGTEILMQRDDLKDKDLIDQLGTINKSLYQIIRTVCNMSDVAQLGINNKANTKICNAEYVFEEIFEKTASLTENLGRSMKFQNLKQNVKCILDTQLIERAVLNVISNAIKFSPDGSDIFAVLKRTESRLSLTIENKIQSGYSGIYGNAFNRFLREPGIESGKFGIGLGMSIVSRAASAHGGTILLNFTRKGVVKVTISIPIRTATETTVKSPIILLDGYTGGIDNYLVELSDVLPNRLYENI